MIGRRALLAGLVTLAPGLTLLRAAPVAGAAGGRWGLLIDTTRCRADCTACVTACQAEQGWGAPGEAHWIRKVTATDPAGGTTALPVLCQHCDQPPCAEVCPTGASFRRADGIVLVDRHRCIGCRYCLLACPIQARSFVATEPGPRPPHQPRGLGTAEACTLCVHRLDAGGIPACVEACGRDGGGAMTFGELDRRDGPLAAALARAAELRPDLGLGGRVRYLGL